MSDWGLDGIQSLFLEVSDWRESDSRRSANDARLVSTFPDGLTLKMAVLGSSIQSIFVRGSKHLLRCQPHLEAASVFWSREREMCLFSLE